MRQCPRQDLLKTRVADWIHPSRGALPDAPASEAAALDLLTIVAEIAKIHHGSRWVAPHGFLEVTSPEPLGAAVDEIASGDGNEDQSGQDR